MTAPDAGSLAVAFYGGTERVTGANFLLESADTKLLVDCGLFQSGEGLDAQNYAPFPFAPSDVAALLVTHAHLDHTGRIPKLIADGFKGIIFSTPETREIAHLMLEDALSVMRDNAEKGNTQPLYDAKAVEGSFRNWHSVPYYTKTDLPGGFSFMFRDAGHILGSAMVEVIYRGTKVLFTGDLGNSPAPFLRDADTPEGIHYLVMESVYGDRTHGSVSERRAALRRVIADTAARRGTLLIPAFSLERTQAMLAEFDALVESGQVPRVPVFLDSPLAIKLLPLYQRSQALFNAGARTEIATGDDIFSFPGLSLTLRADESRAINNASDPKVIIAGSGMSLGGRVLFHERRYLPDPNTTLLIVGYQAPGTLGRRLLEGARDVVIDGSTVPVRARIESIFGYSDHKDRDGLLDFVSRTAATLRTAFVVMGEERAALFLVQRLRDYLNVNAVAPHAGERYTLPLV